MAGFAGSQYKYGRQIKILIGSIPAYLMIKGYKLFFAGMFCMRYRNYVLILIVNLNDSLQAAVFLLERVDMIKEPY